MKCNNEHSLSVLHIHLTLIFFSTFYKYYMNQFFRNRMGIWMFVEINMRAFSWDHIFSLFKEWKVIEEEKETKLLWWITLVLISTVDEGKYHFGGWKPGFKWLGEHSLFERVWIWFLELTSGSSLLPIIPGTWNLKKSSCFCGFQHLYAHTYTHRHTHQK